MPLTIAPAAGTVPASPIPFTPNGFFCAREFDKFDFDGEDFRYRRQEIVCQRRCNRLSAIVIGHRLEQRVADTVNDAPMNLAFRHLGIDRFPAVDPFLSRS